MPERQRFRTHIYCARHRDGGVRLDIYRDGANCARLLFLGVGRALPSNGSSNGVALLFFPISHYPAVVELLSDADPNFFILDADVDAPLSAPKRAGGRAATPPMPADRLTLESGGRGSI